MPDHDTNVLSTALSHHSAPSTQATLPTRFEDLTQAERTSYNKTLHAAWEADQLYIVEELGCILPARVAAGRYWTRRTEAIRQVSQLYKFPLLNHVARGPIALGTVLVCCIVWAPIHTLYKEQRRRKHAGTILESNPVVVQQPKLNTKARLSSGVSFLRQTDRESPLAFLVRWWDQLGERNEDSSITAPEAFQNSEDRHGLSDDRQ